MRFRLGLLVGLAVGYYYGAKAGRERYHQIEDVLDRVRDTDLFRDVADRAGRLIPGGVARLPALFDRTVEQSPILGDPTFN
jgi:hypothetical protein